MSGFDGFEYEYDAENDKITIKIHRYLINSEEKRAKVAERVVQAIEDPSTVQKVEFKERE